jgi:hypothetical protein
MNVLDNQLLWYHADLFEQDYLLKQFVENNKISRIYYLGDCNHVKSIVGKECNQQPQMCIYIVNHIFKFSTIVNICNETLDNFGLGTWLYLSINKFNAIPEPQTSVPDSYDDAIFSYISSQVRHKLYNYISGKNDNGTQFNWVHPLTRFYFRNEDIKKNS